MRHPEAEECVCFISLIESPLENIDGFLMITAL
jgi:hypothetical protein